jgi:hypothetical protein
MINADIIIQEDVLSMVENVVVEIMIVDDDENEVIADGVNMIPVDVKVTPEQKILDKIQQNNLNELKNTDIFASTGVKNSLQDVVMMVQSVMTDVEVEEGGGSDDMVGDKAVEGSNEYIFLINFILYFCLLAGPY